VTGGRGRAARPLARRGGLRRALLRTRSTAAWSVALLLVLFAGSAGVLPGVQSARAAVRSASPAATAATADGTATAVPASAHTSGSANPRITLQSITPNVPQKGSTVQVHGVLTAGRAAVSGASVALRVGQRSLAGRSSIAQIASGNSPPGDQGPLLSTPSAAVPDLAPGASADFTLSFSADAVLHGSDGVYEMDVEAFTGSVQNASQVAISRTFLPWFPDHGGVEPTKIATLWPLTDTPRVQAQTYSESGTDTQVPVLSNDSLAAEMAQNGRLNQLVSIGSGLAAGKIPVTWVVDPDLLDTAQDMASSYRVATSDDSQGARADNTAPGKAGSTATAWLSAARSAVKGQEVVSLPYADPDLASIAHNGGGSKSLVGLLSKDSSAGKFTVDGRLGTSSTANVAWPYQGYVDSEILNTAHQAGDRSVIVSGDSMPESNSLTYTPSAARAVGEGMTAVVSDPAISDIFSGDLSTPGAQTLAEQRFLADTLMITLELPSTQRSILVQPPRNLSVGAAQALSGALEYAVQGKWAQGATLASVASSTTGTGSAVNHTVPPVSRYPSALRSTELSAATLSQVAGVRGSLDTLEKVLTLKYRVTNPFSTAIARSLSTAWRGDGPGGSAYRASMQNYLTNLVAAVRILPKSTVTLTGTSGTIPVSVQNDLQQPVTGLALRLTSQPRLLLNVSPQPVPVSIDGGGRARTFPFRAGAKINSTVEVTAELYSVQGDYVFSTIHFTVNVTSVSGGVLWVLGGGVLLVLLAGLRMYGQRKKRAALGGGADPDGEPAGDGEQPPSGEGPDGGADAGPHGSTAMTTDSAVRNGHDRRIGSESKG